MFKSNRFLAGIFLLALCFPLFACGGAGTPEQVEQAEPTVEPSPEQELTPTAEPIENRSTPITDISQIEGLWIADANPEIFYLRINPDGRVNYAPSLVDLEKGSTNSWTLRLEEDIIYAERFDLCLGEVGTYFGALNPDGTLKFVSIQDSCDFRLRHMDRSLPGRIWEYNLVYSLIE